MTTLTAPSKLSALSDREKMISLLVALPPFGRGLIVGLVEADGSITIGMRKKKSGTFQLTPQVRFTSTTKELAAKVSAMLNARRLWETKGQPNNPKRRRTMYQVQLDRIGEVAGFLEILAEDFIGRRERADLVLSFCHSRLARWRLPYSEAEKDIVERVRALNFKGGKKGGQYPWKEVTR